MAISVDDIITLYKTFGVYAAIPVIAWYMINRYNNVRTEANLKAEIAKVRAEMVQRQQKIMTLLSGGAIKRGKVPLNVWIEAELFDD